MKTNMKMNKILPVMASVGVGLAAYQMFSGNGGKMRNMMPSIASNMMGIPGGGQQGQQSQNQ
ncbi:hypothetical protein [Jeotgalibacillus soli]|uniref:Uncharacterized protein n=1 Tax=Jeotgalibacillus soli TaxID=889306 RepID=A0A0C2W5I0_9BACL|nr:hypothetical protein [Jeotgalibacillus soli]KIL51841.1 hypothetical protein KP78_02110 [Jeotgalibacillus soli]